MKISKDFIILEFKDLTTPIYQWLNLLKLAQAGKDYYKSLDIKKVKIKISKESDEIVITLGDENLHFIQPYYEKDYYEKFLISKKIKPADYGKKSFKEGNEEYEKQVEEPTFDPEYVKEGEDFPKEGNEEYEKQFEEPTFDSEYVKEGKDYPEEDYETIDTGKNNG